MMTGRWMGQAMLGAVLVLGGCVGDTNDPGDPLDEAPQDAGFEDDADPGRPDVADDLQPDADEPNNAPNNDTPDAGTPDADMPDADEPDGGDDLDWVPPCDAEPCPLVIEGFPFQHIADTRDSVTRFDRYACAPNTNEGGPEFHYVFKVDAPGFLAAGVSDGSGVDIDIHLLDAHNPDRCLARNDEALGVRLEPGVYFFVADTWVNGGGNALAGEFELMLNFIPDGSRCAMLVQDIPRINTDELLAMPATGPVVKEAHLVTEEEMLDMLFEGGWPMSITDGIEEHYARSEAVSGFVAERTEPWAPCCEPSNEFGQGSSAPPPLEAEAWYVNMRWRQRPARGERYIVFNPLNGKAVVGAAGYENGPGDLSRIGGAAEEIHLHLETRHLSTMTFGVAADQTLPYGPIDCADP